MPACDGFVQRVPQWYAF